MEFSITNRNQRETDQDTNITILRDFNDNVPSTKLVSNIWYEKKLPQLFNLPNYLSRTEFPNRSLITSLVNTNTDPEEERLSRKVLLQNPQNKVITQLGYSFSTYAKFSEKLTFLTPL